MNEFSIGQMRRNQFTNYQTNMQYTFDKLLNDNTAINFYDPCIFLSGGNIVSFLYSYYLKFEVKQMSNSPQDFILKLKNSENKIESTQTIRIYQVKQGIGSTIFEIIFNPNSNYNEIVFELSRMAIDYNIQNDDNSSGRKMEIKILNFTRVNNVISNYLATAYHGLTTLKKIGIQGPPRMLFCLDGEEIRIGRSGVYELYHDAIEISYLGFVIKDSLFTQDGKDFFILDFKY